MAEEEAVLPNKMLEHSDILETIINIRNTSLRRSILLNKDLNYSRAAEILRNGKESFTHCTVGQEVLLNFDIALNLTRRVFIIEQVRLSR